MLLAQPKFLPAPSFTAVDPQPPDLAELSEAYGALERRLDAANAANEWLEVVQAWDAQRRSFQTWTTLTELRFRQDTTNAAYKRAVDELNAAKPKVTGLDVRLKRRFLASPVRAELEAALGAYAFARWEADVMAYDPAIESLTVRESELEDRYTALLAAMTVEFRGERLNITALAKYAEDPDPATREAAMRAKWSAFERDAAELDEIYGSLVAVRDEMARTLGYGDFVDLGYKRMVRTDYTAADVAAYRKQIVESIVPLASDIVARQAERLGVDRVSFWDEPIFDALGAPRPPQSTRGMIDAGRKVFAQTNPAIDAFASLMVDGGFIDLENRDGKAGGGFCTWFPRYGRPFIFTNFNGTTHDVNVLVHEMGHAFQCYSSRDKALLDYVWPTYDAAEIHSMSMEFFTAPHCEQFFGGDAARYREQHLQTSLLFLPYGAAVDEFQHFVYENPQATPEQRHAFWKELEARYLPWRSYGDIPFLTKGGAWQQQRHIYLYPFYYIDYTLAMGCALQFWMQSETDYAGALERYTALCARGGEAPFQSLARSAGLRSPFEPGVLAGIAAHSRSVLGL